MLEILEHLPYRKYSKKSIIIHISYKKVHVLCYLTETVLFHSPKIFPNVCWLPSTGFIYIQYCIHRNNIGADLTV